MDPAHSVAANAARGFQLFQCEQCANSIRDALLRGGYHGEVIEMRPGGSLPFIICMSYHGGTIAITRNGRHVGVRVGDMVFDNLHPDGMPSDQWMNDFDAYGGVVIAKVSLF